MDNGGDGIHRSPSLPTRSHEQQQRMLKKLSRNNTRPFSRGVTKLSKNPNINYSDTGFYRGAAAARRLDTHNRKKRVKSAANVLRCQNERRSTIFMFFCETRTSFTEACLRFANLARSRDALRVAALQKPDAGRSRGGAAVGVEEKVLEEREPALLPLARVGRALVHVPADAVLVARLVCEMQQLAFVETHRALHDS